MSPWRMADELTNYDMMGADKLDLCSVEELVRYIEVKTARIIPPRFVHALRKASIREASVGVVKLSHNGVASDYNIIPREPLVTPEELAYMKREIELHEDYELNVGKAPEIK